MGQKKNILLITLIIVNIACFSQGNKLSKYEAIQDIDTLKKYIEEIHPNAYAYVQKNELYDEYEKVKKLIDDSLTVYELYNYLTFIAAKYGDGHLSILFPNSWYKDNHNVFALLPNSRIGINVSCKLFFNIGADDDDTHGVIPDFPVKSEKSLDYTLLLIKNNK